MSASKYKDSTIQVIYKTIAETNCERIAWEAAGISKSTYFSWKKKYEEFNLGVCSARLEFLEKNFNIFKVLGYNAYYDLLSKGAVRTKTKTTKELVETPTGDRKLVTTKTTVEAIHDHPPQWAIERAIGRSVDEMDALQKMIESEWFDPAAAAEIATASDGFNSKVRKILKQNAIR